MSLAIIVHGGTGPQNKESKRNKRRKLGLTEAVNIGWEILQSGGNCLDAVEKAVVALENNPLFNAGIGSALNLEGKVEMDAGIMSGKDLGFGAVAAIRGLRNPISVARAVMEKSNHAFLVGEGAEKFAQEVGFKKEAEELFVTKRRLRLLEEFKSSSGSGTVGAVAVDKEGNIAAATSTGGMLGKRPGRVGDSPLIGAGVYANEIGGASATGHGETILQVLMCKFGVDSLEDGRVDPMAAAKSAVNYLQEKVKGVGGIVMLDKYGRTGHAFNSGDLLFESKSYPKSA